MHNYLEEYKEYYRVRAARYEGKPAYANTYAAEKELYEKIRTCNRLEEFHEKLDGANEKVAIALALDEQLLRLKHYQETGESIRAECCRRLLEKAKDVAGAQELLSLINEELTRLNLQLTADSISPFDQFHYVENLEIWEQAEVPAHYKSLFAGNAEQEKQKIRRAWQQAEEEMNKWVPGWKFDVNLLREERHRRLLPLPDSEIESIKSITLQIIQS